MKKIIIFATVGIVLGFFSSCTDFMDIESRTSITDEAVWSSKSASDYILMRLTTELLMGLCIV